METGLKLYWKLFISTFIISAFTVGGGYVIVPLMKKRFVEDYKWLKESEMLDLIALGQSSPGAIAINTSILVGHRMAGLMGSFITALGTLLPPMVIITAVSFFYTAFADNVIVGAVMKGMQAGIVAVILDVVIGMAAKVVKLKKLIFIVIMLVAFIAVYFIKINPMLIILASGTAGAVYSIVNAKKAAREAKHDLS